MPDGFIQVNEFPQVEGQNSVFALGDVSSADVKIAGFAGLQAGVVAGNIKVLISGEGELSPYVSMGPATAVTIGPKGERDSSRAKTAWLGER